jgi:hypothetical protein
LLMIYKRTFLIQFILYHRYYKNVVIEEGCIRPANVIEADQYIGHSNLQLGTMLNTF